MRRLVSGAAHLLLLAALFWVGAGGQTRAERLGVPWRDWSREAFDEARATKRLVLLDLTTTWCHSCRVMAESTYTDPLVVATILGAYIPIRVDHDLRPDVGDRYLGSGWPTTAVLSPEGHLLASTTFLPAKGLRDFLAQATRFYRTNRSVIDRKVDEVERSVAHTWDPDTLEAPRLSPDEYVRMNLDALRDLEDKEHGGFGTSPKTPRWDAISFLLRAADVRRDDRVRALAVRAAAAALVLQDSVDGGFFRAALEPDWSRPRHERLLADQARAIPVLGRVWRTTGEHRFREAADRAGAYVNAALALSARGRADDGGLRWRGSAGPDALRQDGSWIDGQIYFGLSRSARRGLPAPPVSPFVLTDASASFASALLRWNRWSDLSSSGRPPGHPTGAIRADSEVVAALSTLWTTMSRGDGSFYHATVGDERHAPGLLADHAAMGHACLDAYAATRDALWLPRADSVAAWMRANIEDTIGGGFRYAPRDTGAVGRLKAGDKPETANVDAATFFLRLCWLTGNDAYRLVAQRTSDQLRSGPVRTLDPVRAELVLLLEQEPLRLAVVGDGPKAHALWEAALAAPAPEVVVRTIKAPAASDGTIAWPGGFPKGVRAPAVYRWTRTGWRGPVTDPAKIVELLDPPVAGK